MLVFVLATMGDESEVKGEHHWKGEEQENVNLKIGELNYDKDTQF